MFFSASLTAYKLPPLTVAILSLVGLIAFMLLVCLLSCIYKMHRRNEKSKRLMLIAQQAGKGDGEAFRQVTPTWCIITIILGFSVMEEYCRFTELGVFFCVLAEKGLKGRGGFCSCCVSQDGQLVDFLPCSADPGAHGYIRITGNLRTTHRNISNAAPQTFVTFSVNHSEKLQMKFKYSDRIH